MKSNLALVNSIGFINNAQKAWYFANILESVLTSSPKIAVFPAVNAVVGKRAIPGYAGFSLVPAKTIAQNTTGYAAGAIFPGRPQVVAVPASGGYAAVTAIPALMPNPVFTAGVAVPSYPAVPARAAQLEVAPVTAVLAVDLPAIIAITGFENMVLCTATATNCRVEAYLPYSESPKAIGKSIKGVSNIGLLTAETVTVDKWYDTKASATPTTVVTIQPTVERCFYEAALALIAEVPSKGTISTVLIPVNGKSLVFHKIILNLPVTGYLPTSESIQLPKLGAAVSIEQ